MCFDTRSMTDVGDRIVIQTTHGVIWKDGWVTVTWLPMYPIWLLPNVTSVRVVKYLGLLLIIGREYDI